ncbi:hypothetical protein AAF712_016025 [Marasmius tenuissimus]|uniref:Uncharacterized protein n=1 Tax=Marasmius tenuissimus TaxID=585030 RepID=A0ABR2Z7W5_9AGAR
MSGTSFFDHTLKPTLFHPSFVAANVINHNYAYTGRSDGYQGQSTSLFERPSGQLGSRLKTVDIGDIILRREVSSRVIDVMTKPSVKGRTLKLTNPFRARVIRQRQAKFAKVRRTVHVAEILQFGDRPFTVVQFEAEDPNDQNQLELAIRKHISEISSLSRTIHFPQLFAAGSSEIPALIYHDELVSAYEILEDPTYSPIVDAYLSYLFRVTYYYFDKCFLAKISVQFSSSRKDWLFNLRTETFHFDLTSNYRNLSCADSQQYLPGSSEPIALSSNTARNPPLVPRSIIQYLQNQLSDYLISISSLGQMGWIESLSDLLIAHPYLVIGSVINIEKPGIIGHFSPLDTNFEMAWVCLTQNHVDFDWHQFYGSGMKHLFLIGRHMSLTGFLFKVVIV